MKNAALVTTILGCLALAAGTAQADGYTTEYDPTGAPMCFDEDGDKAPLAYCQSYVLSHDPTGAPMCFDEEGDKAPLDYCKTYVKRHDPSGAPMCFDLDGAKAPLAMCETRLAVRTEGGTNGTWRGVPVVALMFHRF